MWSTGEGNGKPLRYSCLENPMNNMKRQKYRTLKDELPRLVGTQYVTGDVSKVQCCKKQYYIGTWNVRSMNQGKLEMVKQKMARVNIDILGISEPRWAGMGELNSDDDYIYYCGQEFLRRNGVALIVHKIVRSAVLGCNLKNDRMISVRF